MNKTKIALFLSLISFYGHAASAAPSGFGAGQAEEQWSFSVSPYMWAASATGRNGPVGHFGYSPVESKLGFSDIFKNSNFALMAIGEARYNRFSVFSDLSYVSFSPNQKISSQSTLDVDSKSFSLAIGGGYAVVHDNDKTLDVLLGGKLWYSSMHYKVDGGEFNGHSRKGNATWIDIIGGLKGKYFITPNIFIEGWSLAGGGQAKFDWDLAGIVGYKINDSWLITSGYRAVGVDYDRNDYVFDIRQKGPILGVTAKF